MDLLRRVTDGKSRMDTPFITIKTNVYFFFTSGLQRLFFHRLRFTLRVNKLRFRTEGGGEM